MAQEETDDEVDELVAAAAGDELLLPQARVGR